MQFFYHGDNMIRVNTHTPQNKSPIKCSIIQWTGTIDINITE